MRSESNVWRWVNGTMAMLRLCVGCILLCLAIDGHYLAGMFGVMECYGATLAILNTCCAKAGDLSLRGVTVAVLYLIGVVAVPGGSGVSWFPLLILQGCFVALRLVSQTYLSKSYSMGVPTWHVLVDRGPFAIVRHPLAVGAIGARLCLMAGNMNWANIASSICYTTAVVATVALEESYLIKKAAEYREYCGRVRWRLVPGVY